jgi:hypothetical protein
MIRTMVAVGAMSLVVQSCGGGSGGPNAVQTPFVVAPHPQMPQVESKGGPVMTAPKLVAITFEGDSLTAGIDTFVQELVATTSYWSATTQQYGVGPLTALPPQNLAEAAGTSITDAQIQSWLASKIMTQALPSPDGNTIYALFYPETTTITSGGGSCQAYQGYHDDFFLSTGADIPYAVMARCSMMGVSAIDQVSAETSHELIETVTDPFPSHHPAWNKIDADDQGWLLLAGSEIADMCAVAPDAWFKPAGMTTLVQRVWSNEAALASHDPCQGGSPQGTSPYFNAAPVLPDTITFVDPMVGSFQTKGVQIPIGSSKTIDLDLYSDAPTSGPWTVSAYDLTSDFFGEPPALSFGFDKTTGQNGDVLHLTITAMATSPMGAAPFWVQCDLGASTTRWVGVVGN